MRVADSRSARHKLMKTEKEKMLAGELYQGWDEALTAERVMAKRLCREFNGLSEELPDERRRVLKTLLGGCPAAIHIESDFRCDYGSNIYLGENFYANFDLTILDVSEVRIGRNCMIAPRVSLFTATHPLDRETRVSGLEYGKPITIGDDVWIGGHAVINPGVTLGDGVVVAAGAVVTKSFPNNVVLAGVPAKVIKTLESGKEAAL